MTPFTYERPDDLASSPAGHPGPGEDGASGSVLLAGGTDLLPLIKLGLRRPATVVDLKAAGLDGRIERDGEGWRLGALATLASVERHTALRDAIPMLSEAVAQAATAQIRNRATVGGTLLQQPRCAYYRNVAVDCLLSGGSSCPAREGRREHLAVVDTGPCIAVQPSDLASALVAADSVVTLRGDGGERRLKVADLLQPPTAARPRMHVLAPGEVITALHVPHRTMARSTYRKAMDRKTWAFALVGLAATVEVADGVVASAGLVATGLAGMPWRLADAEQVLSGRRLDEGAIAQAREAALAGLAPFDDNAYKLPLLQGLLQRALEDLSRPPGA